MSRQKEKTNVKTERKDNCKDRKERLMLTRKEKNTCSFCNKERVR